jgi:hypothetical protein
LTRGRLSLAAVLLTAVAAVLVVRIARSEPPAPQAASGPARLALLVVRTDTAPLVAVVGSGGGPAPAAIVLPARISLTIPGQGDGTVGEAATLPGSQAATAASNLLGMWIPHHVTLDAAGLRSVVDRAGGIEVGGTTLSGTDAVASLASSGVASEAVWETTLEALLRVASWEPADVPESDRPTAAAELLNAARGAAVEVLPTEEVPGGLLRTDPETIRAVVTAAFGVEDRQVLPAIVLNGSGEPGIGEHAAERLIPGGFRVVVSENASSFDHDTTLVVVPSEEHLPLGERVRDLLGVGEVQVAGPASGLADVTIVVGKDFTA